MSFIERFFLLCPLFRVSFIGGSTVLCMYIHTLGLCRLREELGSKAEIHRNVLMCHLHGICFSIVFAVADEQGFTHDDDFPRVDPNEVELLVAVTLLHTV